MARITIEDCLEHIPNRFNVVITAAKRARSVALGGDALVDIGSDKPTVVALRELASGQIDPNNVPEYHPPEPIAPSFAMPADPALSARP